MKKKKKIKSDICVRCWLEKKTVRVEWSNWCYVYHKKQANRHMWTYYDTSKEVLVK